MNCQSVNSENMYENII